MKAMYLFPVIVLTALAGAVALSCYLPPAAWPVIARMTNAGLRACDGFETWCDLEDLPASDARQSVNSRDESLSPDRTISIPMQGSKYLLHSPLGKSHVIARDVETRKRYFATGEAQSGPSVLVDLIQSGALFIAEDGTHVEVVRPASVYSEIRVSAGPHLGKVGVVPNWSLIPHPNVK